MTTEVTNRLNDVDIETVGALIGAVQEDQTNAHTTWKANVKWNGAFRSEVRIRDFAPIPSDEPAGLGGHDSAPNPVEQLLGALGNCLVVGYAANATAAGITIDDLQIDLEGDLNLHTFLGLDDDGHAGYHAIRASVRIESPASDEEIAQLHERVVGTSPVGHTLVRPIDVAIDIDRS